MAKLLGTVNGRRIWALRPRNPNTPAKVLKEVRRQLKIDQAELRRLRETAKGDSNYLGYVEVEGRVAYGVWIVKILTGRLKIRS